VLVRAQQVGRAGRGVETLRKQAGVIDKVLANDEKLLGISG
jgi:hypothetical protein